MSDHGLIDGLRSAPSAQPRLAVQGGVALADIMPLGDTLRLHLNAIGQSRMLHPLPVDLHRGPQRLAGVVQNASEQPLSRLVVAIDRASGIAVRQTQSDALTGRFEFLGLRAGVRYLVVALDDAPVEFNAARDDNVEPA